MTNPAPTLLAAGLALALGACTTLADVPTERVGQARLSFANGLPAGTAQLLRSGTGLSVAVAVTGMTPGPHGFHIHAVGRCEAPGFESAGGHLNPYGRKHGTQAEAGPHLGDMENIVVGPSGSGAGTFDLPGSGPGDVDAIFDADGAAIIVHAGADDYRTDPSGNSGARIACGVLTRAD
jgi:superoxide dismutase, Cu-Zn family